MYILLLTALFGASTKPVIKNLGKGNIGELKGMCQDGSRSHMQMLVNLVSFDKYRIALLEEWFFGKGSGANAGQKYAIKIDGKSVHVKGIPYFTGMYTYSPVFVTVYQKKVKWEHISTEKCQKLVFGKYTKGIELYPTTAMDNLKPCNIMSLNNETVEIAPLFISKNNHVFLLRVKSDSDSVNVVIAKEGKLQKSVWLKSNMIYTGIMDNAKYDIQIGNIDINLPEALELLGE